KARPSVSQAANARVRSISERSSGSDPSRTLTFMANDARIVLQQRLTQQLVMTPQLRQAIKILQVSRAELETLIDQEMIENPVLEENLEDKTPEGEYEVPTVDGLKTAEE